MRYYYWDEVDKTRMGEYITRKEGEFINSFMKRNTKGNTIKTCLDVACGSGRFSIPLTRYNIDVVAVDFDLVPLKKLKDKNKDMSVQICRGDAIKLPFKQSIFDVILSIDTIDYLDAQKFFKQCKEILKIDGYLIFTISNRNSFKYYLHRYLSEYRTFYRYDYQLIISYLEIEGFKVDKCIGYNWIPFKRDSNSIFIRFFEFLESTLKLEYFPIISPWMFFIVKKENNENSC